MSTIFTIVLAGISAFFFGRICFLLLAPFWLVVFLNSMAFGVEIGGELIVSGLRVRRLNVLLPGCVVWWSFGIWICNLDSTNAIHLPIL